MKTPRSIQEETLDRTIRWIEGPFNDAAERALKSRLLLSPAGLLLNVWCRGLIAAQTGDLRALFRRPQGDERGAS
jgi:hypothetical protein